MRKSVSNTKIADNDTISTKQNSKFRISEGYENFVEIQNRITLIHDNYLISDVEETEIIEKQDLYDLEQHSSSLIKEVIKNIDLMIEQNLDQQHLCVGDTAEVKALGMQNITECLLRGLNEVFRNIKKGKILPSQAIEKFDDLFTELEYGSINLTKSTSRKSMKSVSKTNHHPPSSTPKKSTFINSKPAAELMKIVTIISSFLPCYDDTIHYVTSRCSSLVDSDLEDITTVEPLDYPTGRSSISSSTGKEENKTKKSKSSKKIPAVRKPSRTLKYDSELLPSSTTNITNSTPLKTLAPVPSPTSLHPLSTASNNMFRQPSSVSKTNTPALVPLLKQHSSRNQRNSITRPSATNTTTNTVAVLKKSSEIAINMYPINTSNKSTSTDDFPNDNLDTSNSTQPMKDTLQDFKSLLTHSSNPLLAIYEQFQNTLPVLSKNKLLHFITKEIHTDSTSTSTKTSVLSLFQMSYLQLELLHSGLVEIERNMSRIEKDWSDWYSLSDICKANETYQRNLQNIFSTIGRETVTLLSLQLQLQECQFIVHSFQQSVIYPLQELYKEVPDFDSCINCFTDCQRKTVVLTGRIADLKAKCHQVPVTATGNTSTTGGPTFANISNAISLHTPKVYGIPPRHSSNTTSHSFSSSSSTSYSTEDELQSLRTQLENLQKIIFTQSEDLKTADNDIRQLELELFESQQMGDRTPSALLFFASLQDEHSIPTLQQLILQLSHLKSFVDGDAHVDFLQLKKRIVVCVDCLPVMQNYMSRYSTIYQKWTQDRLKAHKGRNGGGVIVSGGDVCPICHIDIRLALPNASLIGPSTDNFNMMPARRTSIGGGGGGGGRGGVTTTTTTSSSSLSNSFAPTIKSPSFTAIATRRPSYKSDENILSSSSFSATTSLSQFRPSTLMPLSETESVGDHSPLAPVTLALPQNRRRNSGAFQEGNHSSSTSSNTPSIQDAASIAAAAVAALNNLEYITTSVEATTTHPPNATTTTTATLNRNVSYTHISSAVTGGGTTSSNILQNHTTPNVRRPSASVTYQNIDSGNSGSTKARRPSTSLSQQFVLSGSNDNYLPSLSRK